MTWIFSILIGLLTAGLGCFGAGFVATLCVRWYRISSFEGNSGYYVVFIALLGAIVGLIGGVIVSRLAPVSDGAIFWKGLGYAWGTMTTLLLVVTIFAWLAADISPRQNGRRLEIVTELRCPVGFKLPPDTDELHAYAAVHVPGGRGQSPGRLEVGEAKEVEGRWIVGAVVPLDTSQSRVFLQASFGQEHVVYFPVGQKLRVGKADTWSEWIEAESPAGEQSFSPDKKFSLRYRVRIVPPPPPQPSEAELALQKEAAEQVTFEAIPPDAPIAAWLPYLAYGAADHRRQAALNRIVARPHFPTEFAESITVVDAEQASVVLRLVEDLPEPSSELNAPVAEAGRGIAALIRTVNTTPVEQDPSYLKAAEVSIRFSAWMVAVRTLRAKAGGDFTRELKEILELARVRTESQTLRSDVVRVASFYLHEWTGLAPLATDPAPR